MDTAFCYDILLQILQNLDGCYDALYRCALVNWEFHRVASKFLYKCIEFGRLETEAQFSSSVLPRYAPNVLVFRISGHHPTKLLTAVQSYSNLYSVTLSTQVWDVLHALRDCRFLRELTVSSFCTQKMASLIAELSGLHKLTISGPNRAILQILPEWLGRLSCSLVELHLTDNCGSITPGVLRSFVPHIQKINALTLGLSYSLTNEDVFSVLADLPRLESVQIQYYLQLKKLPRIHLSNLRSFTVRHSCMQKREDVNRLCVWIRHVLSRTVALQSLRIICDDAYSRTGANVSFDGLADHLASKHASTLRSLRMGSSFIGVKALRNLCTSCANLEELEVAVGERGLRCFSDFVSDMRKLHTVSFNVRNVRSVSFMEAVTIWENAPSGLRRLTIDRLGVRWEGSWQSDETGPKFVVACNQPIATSDE